MDSGTSLTLSVPGGFIGRVTAGHTAHGQAKSFWQTRPSAVITSCWDFLCQIAGCLCSRRCYLDVSVLRVYSSMFFSQSVHFLSWTTPTDSSRANPIFSSGTQGSCNVLKPAWRSTGDTLNQETSTRAPVFTFSQIHYSVRQSHVSNRTELFTMGTYTEDWPDYRHIKHGTLFYGK